MTGSDDALDRLFQGKPETLTVKAVADLLQVTEKNVYAWLRDGVIPAYKIGSHWRVLRDELRETMREGSNSTE